MPSRDDVTITSLKDADFVQAMQSDGQGVLVEYSDFRDRILLSRAAYGLHTFTTGAEETTQAITAAQVKAALGLLATESIDTAYPPTIVKACAISEGVYTVDDAVAFTWTAATGAFALSGLTAATDYAIFFVGKAKLA